MALPPLLERAHTRKQDALEAEGLRWQVEKRDTELNELKRSLRMRTEEMSEMRVRYEMSEKKLSATGRQGDELVERLQRRIEDLLQELKNKEQSVMLLIFIHISLCKCALLIAAHVDYAGSRRQPSRH